MKIYLSVDMEGITGLSSWDEVLKEKKDYCNKQLTQEVKAACQGAIAAGAKEVWINDAHDSGRNIDFAKLPPNTKLISSWSGNPLSMMQELDESFTAALMIGYHSASGTETNPLAHTMSSKLNYLKINGEPVSEFIISAYTAAMFKVPVVFLSGDQGVCQEVKEINKNIETVAVKEGKGKSVISIHPEQAKDNIKKGVEQALTAPLEKYQLKLPEYFKVELSFTAQAHPQAYKASFYPGMKKLSATKVLFETQDYFEVLKMILFVL
ncbi:M55 family metallopeptidase [Fuchsiella alkaliacetigena]|uniref:M55 family metallopeptidase n=1 Tax=Fuchsiella alkaliacetigena TaxID=957042 RepID=UPI002009DE8B|nr:M55 family metallopeptidase [Fuchsiella alkaliacetigena]MCK8826109.1 M55 family metallopeptidase [Fuchsiella alkaliacetigena]